MSNFLTSPLPPSKGEFPQPTLSTLSTLSTMSNFLTSPLPPSKGEFPQPTLSTLSTFSTFSTISIISPSKAFSFCCRNGFCTF
jgi:hypothetical protein